MAPCPQETYIAGFGQRIGERIGFVLPWTAKVVFAIRGILNTLLTQLGWPCVQVQVFSDEKGLPECRAQSGCIGEDMILSRASVEVLFKMCYRVLRLEKVPFTPGASELLFNMILARN